MRLGCSLGQPRGRFLWTAGHHTEAYCAGVVYLKFVE
jgi:hypothetical protein